MNSTPGTTTSTSMDRPIGRKLMRVLSIFVSALLVYATATVVYLTSNAPVAGRVTNTKCIRGTIAITFKDFNPVLVAIYVILFTFSALVNGFFCISGYLVFVRGGRPKGSFVANFHVLTTLIVFINTNVSVTTT